MESLLETFDSLKISRNDVAIIAKYISDSAMTGIVLLRNKEVIQWLLNDTSFLVVEDADKLSQSRLNDKKKALEDVWGRSVMKSFRPDLKMDCQWTNLFGENICKEIYTLLGCTVSKPDIKQHFHPDLQTEDFIIEVKTQTHFTTGTASEKILGTPFKYADVPDLYAKPLKIICVGGAEVTCSRFGCLNESNGSVTAKKKDILEFYRKHLRIEYISASSLLKSIIRK